jgi:hypothetical protein
LLTSSPAETTKEVFHSVTTIAIAFVIVIDSTVVFLKNGFYVRLL